MNAVRTPLHPLRLAAGTATAGIVLTLIAFAALLLGVVDPFADISSAQYLGEIRTAPTLWLAVHLLVAVAVLGKLAGMLALGGLLERDGRSATVQAANAFAVVGAVLLVVTMVRDGYVHGFLAASWQAATDPAVRTDWERTFAASLRTSYGMEIASLIALLGLAPLAYSAVILQTGLLPRWLGRLGVVGGAGSLVTGGYLWMTGPSDVGYGALYPPFAVLLPAVWLTAVAVQLWRQAPVPAGSRTGPQASRERAPEPVRG